MPTLNFGKYAGLSLEDVPRDYLEWLRDSRRKDVNDYDTELRRRELIETTSLSWAEKIVSEGYRSLAKKNHPDTGGSQSEFQQLQAAYEQLKVVLKEVQKIGS